MVIDIYLTNFTKTSHIICAVFIAFFANLVYYKNIPRKGDDILNKMFRNSDVDDMIYGTTVTVPSDR